jgi:cell division protein FtsN
MTTTHPDVQQTPPVQAFQPPKLGRWFLVCGGLGIVTVLGYTVGRFTDVFSSAPPTPVAHVAVVQTPTPAPEPRPAAAVTPPPRDQSEGVADDDEDVKSEAAAATPPTTGSFFVQVASYKAETDAEKYAAELSARGLNAQASPDPTSSSWHQVRLGPFQSRGQAEKARFQLKIHEREKAYVNPRSNGKYHVQVGSFATVEEAESVASRFIRLGHVTKISRIKMGDRRWHCVRIGPFDTAQEAADYQELVKGVSNTESAVIPYGPPKG